MAMAPTVKVVLGSIAFAIFWVLAVFPAVPFLPIGRTAGSLLGAMLMVLFHVISADEAYAAIDLPILGLLFGTMVVSVYLERADMFKYLGKLLAWKSNGGKDLLCRVCLVSGLASALFTNDTCCVVLTEFILKIARQNNLPPQPFLLALASSANIGSATTPIGNPQNLVIAVQSKISFGKFLLGILPAMIVGISVNAVILLCYYWKVLSTCKDVGVANLANDVINEGDATSHRFSPATMSHLNSGNSRDLGSVVDAIIQSPSLTKGDTGNLRSRVTVSHSENDILSAAYAADESNKVTNEAEAAVDGTTSEKQNAAAAVRKHVRSGGQLNGVKEGLSNCQPSEVLTERRKRLLWKTCVYLITLGMLVALLLGLNMSWSAITAALALIVLDFKDARPCLEKVTH